MSDLEDLYTPFGVTKVKKKIKYCNINIIPRLQKMNIEWNMDTRRIIFRGRVFPMKYIDNGDAEDFIDRLEENSQTILDIWKTKP